jgi:hypothetical protein
MQYRKRFDISGGACVSGLMIPEGVARTDSSIIELFRRVMHGNMFLKLKVHSLNIVDRTLNGWRCESLMNQDGIMQEIIDYVNGTHVEITFSSQNHLINNLPKFSLFLSEHI